MESHPRGLRDTRRRIYTVSLFGILRHCTEAYSEPESNSECFVSTTETAALKRKPESNCKCFVFTNGTMQAYVNATSESNSKCFVSTMGTAVQAYVNAKPEYTNSKCFVSTMATVQAYVNAKPESHS